MFFPHTSINCKGFLLELDTPIVMGILNVTPDSFYDGGKHREPGPLLQTAEKMLREGASILDIGGMSSRPGAKTISTKEELDRVLPAIQLLLKHFQGAILSIDTFRSEVAAACLEEGCSIINDISAGLADPGMFDLVASKNVPYILMHMQGTPQTMQQNPHYQDASLEILDFFIERIGILRAMHVKDIIVDPGFGFGKTVEHNYQLLQKLHVFKILDVPILAGISRKSMVCKVLGITPDKALNGTTALHMVALQQGARILRVHDVGPAMEVIQLWKAMEATT